MYSPVNERASAPAASSLSRGEHCGASTLALRPAHISSLGSNARSSSSDLLVPPYRLTLPRGLITRSTDPISSTTMMGPSQMSPSSRIIDPGPLTSAGMAEGNT